MKLEELEELIKERLALALKEWESVANSYYKILYKMGFSGRMRAVVGEDYFTKIDSLIVERLGGLKIGVVVVRKSLANHDDVNIPQVVEMWRAGCGKVVVVGLPFGRDVEATETAFRDGRIMLYGSGTCTPLGVAKKVAEFVCLEIAKWLVEVVERDAEDLRKRKEKFLGELEREVEENKELIERWLSDVAYHRI